MARKWAIVWMACLILIGWIAPALAGFVDNDDGTVTDTSTGLMWQQATAPGAYTWEQALAYCEGLSPYCADLPLAGFGDWRLPTRKELRSLVDCSRYNLAINTTYFPDTAASWYWSSTTAASNTHYASSAWVVYFYYGNDSNHYKYNNYYVRAVRGGQSGSLGNLTIILQPQDGGAVTGPGISCGNGGTDCQEAYALGTSVTLTAQANDGYEFEYWDDGNACFYNSSITITMDADKTLTAKFNDLWPYSRYNFTYYYNNGSNDTFSGYVIDRDGLVNVGQKLEYNTSPLGNALIPGGGYYLTTTIQNYTGSSRDSGKCYVTQYYDGDTGKSSDTLYKNSKGKTEHHELYIGNKGLGQERGYVYDPSVRANDAYFGNKVIVYSFSLTASNPNFLVKYITDLRYWNQPSGYQGSCAEIAGSIILSYWDLKGFSDLIEGPWQTYWPDNTKNDMAYILLIRNLSEEMGRDPAWGKNTDTLTENVGPGLKNYASERNYDFKFIDYKNVIGGLWYNLSGKLEKFTDAMDAGRPVILTVAYSEGNHSVVGRGYWKDGYVVANLGWGTKKINAKLYWNWVGTRPSSYKSDPNGGFVWYMTDFYPSED